MTFTKDRWFGCFQILSNGQTAANLIVSTGGGTSQVVSLDTALVGIVDDSGPTSGLRTVITS